MTGGHGWLRGVCPDAVFTPQVELGIRRALGLCPPHSRTLHATTRYLAWLAEVGPSRYSPREAQLCPEHAADLLERAPGRPLPVLSVMLRQEWASRLTLAHATPDTGACHVCGVARVAELRAEEVLAALLSDSAGRAVPLLGFGPCHKHVLGWHDRPTARLVRGLHATRLRLAELDVRDEGRRLSWDHRYDAASSAPFPAVQALALLDGDVLLSATQVQARATGSHQIAVTFPAGRVST